MVKSYLKERIQLIILFLIFLTIFGLIFYLYHLPIEHYFYAGLIILVNLLLYMIFDYLQYSKKHHELKDLQNNISSLQENLPKAITQSDIDYQILIQNLTKDNRRLISEADEKHTDLIEYYTLWTHQIKTPLSAIDFLLQDRSEDVFDDMELQIMDVESYIDMALEYLRIENMTSDLKFENYSIQRIVNTAIKAYSKMFIYKNIGLELEMIDISVITDKKWLLFVVKQLLSNALKYTPEGKVMVYLEGSSLYIEDTGIGIQEEDIASIFDRGFTGYNGRINRKSTGLGLYLVKEVMDNLGHSINITSTVGVGTNVKIDLSQIKLQVK